MTKISALPSDSAPTLTDSIPTLDIETLTTKRITLQTLQNLIAKTSNLSNLYKFSAYKTASITPGSGDIVFDSVEFDTSSNYSVSTGKFTAPVAGFYYFVANVGVQVSGVTGMGLGLYKNGSMAKQGDNTVIQGTNYPYQAKVEGMISLNATDYITVRLNNITAGSSLTGANVTYFQGFLFSAT